MKGGFLFHLGRYVLLIKSLFVKPERPYMYWKETARMMVDIGVGSVIIILVISFFIGAVLTDAWGIIDFPEERLMPVEDIAKSIYDIYSLSDRTVVEEIILRPMLGDL